jgi:hypothetical protein
LTVLSRVDITTTDSEKVRLLDISLSKILSDSRNISLVVTNQVLHFSFS